uniref:Titin n=1 Tax=Stegastes partitus TaxID=144197 RepID=A0A3B5AE95_9TELE
MEGGTLSERAQIEVASSYTVLLIENVNRNNTGKYVLTAENCSGVKSAFINVRILDSPSAPTNLEVKDVKRDSVSISWEPPIIDGGAKISHYIVEKREEARKAFTSVCSNCVRNSYKIDNLQEGCFYYFRVLAVNEFGTGLPAETADAVKVSEVPLPPGKVTLSDVTSNSARLSWEKPDHDGGSKITCYIVEMQAKGEDTWTKCSESKALEVTINGLTKGKEYFFRVSAMNEKGQSEPKSLLVPVTVKDTSAGPVINLLSNSFSVKAGNDLKIDVPYKGAPPPTVAWKREGNLLKETSRVNVHTSDTASQIIIKDATKLDVGVYEVTLTNSVGTTSAEILVNVFERPGPPSDLSVDEVSVDFVSLSWQPPHYTGGCQISNYVVEKRDTGSTIWQTVSATVARTSIKISRLTQGTEYQFRIAAENRYGKSHFIESDPVVAQYPFKPPGSPTNLHVVQASKSVMVIAWSKPDSDGGSPITGYHIECKDQSSILWTKLNRGPFRVCAENIAGVGPCSKASEPVAARDQPGPPAGPLEVSGLSAEKCTLSWGPPHETGGAEVMYYIVEKCETSRVAWTLVYGDMMATTCKITKLLKGNEYLFRVRAVNKYGEGETLESDPVRATDPFTIPSAPMDVEVTSATNEAMTICWKRPVTDGGSRISGYIIEKRDKQGVRWVRVNKKPVYDLRAKASGLHEGCEYEFRVFAENAAGLSEPSLPSKPSIVDSTRSSITLSWNKPLFDGGAAVTGYKVEFRKSTEEDWSVGVNNTDKTEFTVTGLTAETEYVFVVRSINKIGTSEPSPETDPEGSYFLLDYSSEGVPGPTNDINHTHPLQPEKLHTLRLI